MAETAGFARGANPTARRMTRLRQSRNQRAVVQMGCGARDAERYVPYHHAPELPIVPVIKCRLGSGHDRRFNAPLYIVARNGTDRFSIDVSLPLRSVIAMVRKGFRHGA
jgi:hypothetical protein